LIPNQAGFAGAGVTGRIYKERVAEVGLRAGVTGRGYRSRVTGRGYRKRGYREQKWLQEGVAGRGCRKRVAGAGLQEGVTGRGLREQGYRKGLQEEGLQEAKRVAGRGCVSGVTHATRSRNPFLVVYHRFVDKP